MPIRPAPAPLRATALAAAVALVLLAAPAPRAALAASPGDAARAAGEPDAKRAPVVIRGRLLVRKGDDGVRRLEIEVGKTRYVIAGAGGGAEKLARRYVAATGTIERADGVSVIHLATRGAAGEDADDAGDSGDAGVPGTRGPAPALTEQKPGPVRGTVALADETKGVRGGFVLEGEDADYEVPRAAVKKLAPFLGKHVAALAYVVSGPGHAELAGVKEVTRRLLPGEREPETGEQALGASWTGSFVVERLPSRAPGVEKGDSLPLSFATDAELASAHGRVMDAYDVAAVRLRKFSRKRRTVTFTLAYTFGGGGSYDIEMEATFSADWKTLTGTWRSGFLGAGTFEAKLTGEAPPKTRRRGDGEDDDD